MADSADHFEEFDDHTLFKHAILRSYVSQWAAILLSRNSKRHEVHVVDAFAGPGADRSGNPGSPLICAKIAANVREMKGLTDGAHVLLTAIDARQTFTKSLETRLAPFNRQDPGSCLVLTGSLREHLATVVARIGASPTLFFLDPYGIQGLHHETYGPMLSGERNEVFVLFSDVGAVRNHGLARADSRRIEARFRGRTQPSLFPEWAVSDEERAQRQREAALQALDVSQPKAKEHLVAAFGSEAIIEELSACPRSERGDHALQRFAELLLDAGASHVLMIPMCDSNGRYKHTFVHAARSVRALLAMKSAVSAALSKDDLSLHMRDRIREDLELNVSWAADWVGQRFAGQEVRWTAGKAGGEDRGTVKRVLLEETHLFDFQAKDVRNELQARGYLKRKGRVLVAHLPPRTAPPGTRSTPVHPEDGRLPSV